MVLCTTTHVNVSTIKYSVVRLRKTITVPSWVWCMIRCKDPPYFVTLSVQICAVNNSFGIMTTRNCCNWIFLRWRRFLQSLLYISLCTSGGLCLSVNRFTLVTSRRRCGRHTILASSGKPRKLVSRSSRPFKAFSRNEWRELFASSTLIAPSIAVGPILKIPRSSWRLLCQTRSMLTLCIGSLQRHIIIWLL